MNKQDEKPVDRYCSVEAGAPTEGFTQEPWLSPEQRQILENARVAVSGSEIKAGDVVALLPGGNGSTPMVVVDVGAFTGLVWCRWLVDGVLDEYGFPAASLTRVTRDEVRAFVTG